MGCLMCQRRLNPCKWNGKGGSNAELKTLKMELEGDGVIHNTLTIQSQVSRSWFWSPSIFRLIWIVLLCKRKLNIGSEYKDALQLRNYKLDYQCKTHKSRSLFISHKSTIVIVSE